MRRRIPVALLCLWLLHAMGHAARGDDGLRVLATDHNGVGRIAFTYTSPVAYRLAREGDHLLLRFDTTATIEEPASLPRNVLGYSAGVGEADIVIVHGARAQLVKIPHGVAIDVSDAPPRKDPAAKAATPAAGSPPPPNGAASPARAADTDPSSATPGGAHAPTPAVAAAPAPLAAGGPPPAPVPAAAQTAPAGPVAEAPAPARPGGPPVETTAATALSFAPAAPSRSETSAPPPAVAATPGTIRLAFGSTTGLAALRRGGTAVLAFDERRPLDLASFRDDPVFGAAVVQLLPEATIVRVPLPPSMALAFHRTSDGWTVTAGPAGLAAQPITPVLADRAIRLDAAAPGRVLSVPDPETGGLLLLGTQRESGQGVGVQRRTAEYELLPTWQGVAVDPLSASLFLRAAKDGFLLGAETGGLAQTAPDANDEAYAAAMPLTRRFDFLPLAPEALQRRLQGQVDAVAAAAPLARAHGRRAVAETMIALGLGSEAHGMLRLAAEEDARVLDDADAVGLSAIAALLADRDGEAGGLSDPRLDGTDEISLWRAVRQAKATDGSPPAAKVFATTLPLVLAYPAPLRDRLLPLVAETLAANDQTLAGKLLASLPDDPRLSLAHGMVLQAKGDRDGALAIFDRLAAGPDRLLRLRAARQAVEVRLASGQLDARGAADALQRQFLAWRGDRNEVDLRLRTAALRAAAGQWRAALGLLRETEALSPEQQPAVHAELLKTFAAACADHNADAMPPLELVALLDENADLLPAGEPGTDLATRLADRLLALDLPRRAEAVLARLVRATAGPVRASFGARLAALRLREGSPADALATLADTESEELPEAVQQQRTTVRAGALARRGDAAGAARLLADLGTPEATEMRASILESAHDWREAEQALAEYADRTVPPEGTLSEAQSRTVLRWAVAASQAGDAAALGALERREGKRMEAGSFGDVFKLLTASPVQGGADLARAASEINLARSLPSGLKAMGTVGKAP